MTIILSCNHCSNFVGVVRWDERGGKGARKGRGGGGEHQTNYLVIYIPVIILNG